MKTNFSAFRLMPSPALALAITIFSTALILWGVSVVQAKRDTPASAQAVSRAAALLPPDNDPKRTARIRELYGKLPLQFEANQGQAAAPTKFIARGQGYNLSLLPGQAVLRLRRQAEQETELVLKFVGANTEAALQGEDALPGKSNYFVGNDPTRWQTNVATFAKVKYQNLYPGVDLIYYGQQGRFEYDFVLAPGADVRPIQMAFEGVQAIQIDQQGQLVLHTKNGVVRQLKPVIYQTVQGKRREIQGRYIRQGRKRVGFQIGKYNHSLPLVIDPILEYSTFIGGTSIEQGSGIAVDKDGNAYITGDTFSTDFPVAGTLQPVKNNVNDAFVLKLNAAGSAIVYATYLGGAGSDTANGIALDAAGNAYVTGVTSSADFPITNGALQPTFKGLSDAFITKINAAGTALVYSSYLGGTGRDAATAIAVDSAGSAYIAGRTDSSDLPATGIQTTRNGALAYKTLNGGGAWASNNNNLVGSLTNAIAVNPTYPNIVYLSTNSGSYRTINEGALWQPLSLPPFTSTSFPLVTSFAINPKNPGIVYGGGSGVYKSTDDGATWVAKNTGLLQNNVPPLVNALVIDPKQPDTLYAGTSSGLYKTTDGGETWTAMNFGLNYQPLTAAQIRITELVVDPNAPMIVYAGTVNGVFKTTDGGSTWTTFSNGLQLSGQLPSEIASLVIDKTNPSILYASPTTGQGGVYKTVNGGVGWEVVSNGLRVNINGSSAPLIANSLATDPIISGTIYAGTNIGGVFKSSDAGVNWNRISDGLNNINVQALALDPTTPAKIYAGTFIGNDGFVAKVNPAGSGLSYLSYLGGNEDDEERGIALDKDNNAYLIGSSNSSNYPTVNPIQPNNSPFRDVVVSKVNATGTALVYSTFLGGISDDQGRGIAVNAAGEAYLTGFTFSFNFPTVKAVMNTLGGSSDAFVTKLSSDGKTLLFSTYLGGQITDQGLGIALDKTGDVYVAGVTNSPNFPLVNAYQSQLNGPNFGLNNDAFATKLDGAGTKILYSTFLGGRSSDQANAIAVDAVGNAYLTGLTNSLDFPTVNPLAQNRNSDVFIAKLTTAADVSLTMTDSRDPVMVGNEFTYNLTVTNNGPDTANNVVVTDTLPANVTVGSIITNQGNCTGTGPLICNLGTLEQNAKVTITLTLTPNVVGTITNQASVTSSTFDATTGNNSASQSTKISDKPSILGRVALASGEGVGKVAIKLTGNAATTTTSVDGAYQFLELPLNSNLTITPTRKGYVFNPPSQTLNNLNKDQTVNFTAVLCDFTLMPVNQLFANVGGAGSIQIASPDPQCQWTARSNAAWIKLTSPTSGTHSGAVSFTVDPTAAPRSGTITVAGKTFTVMQEVSPCNGVEFNLPAVATAYVAATQFVNRDFNGDGFVDVAMISPPDQTVSLSLNDGKGNFNQLATVILSGVQPKSLHSGDVNGDGKMDLVFVNNSTDNNIYLLFGNGMGGFAAPRTFKAGTNPNWVALGDFNGDKKVDLLVGNSSTNGGTPENIAAVYPGNGDGTFATGKGVGDPLSFFDPVIQVEVGDFNGDGKLDALLGTRNNGVRILPGDGAGGFVSAMGSAPINAVASVVADFNRDGKSDYAYLYNGRIYALLGQETISSQVYEMPGALNIAAADINADGKQDLLGLSQEGVLIRIGNGDGTFGELVTYSSGMKNSTMSVLDADGDGRLDILVAGTFTVIQTQSIGWAVLRGTRDGGLNAPRLNVAFPANPNLGGDGIQQLLAADFNRDGADDLWAMAGGGRFATLLGNGIGGFKITAPVNSEITPQAVQVRDFNRDGNPDLAILAGNASTIKIYLGDGKGAFPTSWIVPLNSFPNDFEIADFNQDGNLDLLVKTSDNTLAIMTGDGKGVFTETVTGLAPPGNIRSTFTFTQGDFNGDGENDIAIVQAYKFGVCTDTKLVMLPGEGNGVFGDPVISDLPVGPDKLYASDLNGDGRTDLVFTERCTSNRNAVNVLYANANGSFGAPVNIATGAEPKFIVIGDVNGDGRKDILVSSFVSGNIAIVRGGVGNSFFNAALFPTFQRSGAIALGDFNGDGKPDIGVGNFDTNTVMALLNRNNCFTANKIVTTNAANFIGTKLTPEGIASSFGAGLATSTQVAAGIPLPTTLAGTTVKIKDSLGTEFLAPLFFVAAQQVNWQVPKGVAEGIASVTITSGAGSISTGTVEITKVVPGIFAASADGAGVLAASVLRIKPNGDRSFEQTALYLAAENKYVARELILGADDLFLEIYGTGIRNRSGLAQVTAKIGEVNAEGLYAGAHCCFVGVDQINVKIPKTLAGRGEVDIVLTIDGKETNPLRLNIK